MTATKKKWKDKTLKEKIGTIGEKGKPIADTFVAINKEGQPGAIGGDDIAVDGSKHMTQVLTDVGDSLSKRDRDLLAKLT